MDQNVVLNSTSSLRGIATLFYLIKKQLRDGVYEKKCKSYDLELFLISPNLFYCTLIKSCSNRIIIQTNAVEKNGYFESEGS